MYVYESAHILVSPVFSALFSSSEVEQLTGVFEFFHFAVSRETGESNQARSH